MEKHWKSIKGRERGQLNRMGTLKGASGKKKKPPSQSSGLVVPGSGLKEEKPHAKGKARTGNACSPG